MDEKLTFDDYQPKAHSYEIKALRADVKAMDTELRHGF